MVAVGVSEVKNNRPSHKEDSTVHGSARHWCRDAVDSSSCVLVIYEPIQCHSTATGYGLLDWTGLDGVNMYWLLILTLLRESLVLPFGREGLTYSFSSSLQWFQIKHFILNI